jgi:hypothetical protein
MKTYHCGLSILFLCSLSIVGLCQKDSRASYSGTVPTELQFSDFRALNGREEEKAKILQQVDHPGRLAAAQSLWDGHSRPNATEVLKYLAGPPQGGDEYRLFQKEVEAALQPRNVLKELQGGDYEWGAWLAFLRPHGDFTPTLLAALKDKPKLLPETILALGNSGDPRAKDPLLDLLKSKDYRTAGDAAQALGYLGDPDTEPALIAALASDNGWRQVKVSGALAKMGTSKAIPALEKVANDERYTGALAIKSVAGDAIKAIQAREKKKK